MISYRRFVVFLLIIFFLILDQAIKIAIEFYLPLHQPMYVLPFIYFYRTHNTGVSFSFFSDISPWIIIILRLFIISFTIFIWNISLANKNIFSAGLKNNNMMINIGFMLIISGALGNLMDQCIYGYVVDYIMIQIKNIPLPIFNLADSLISIGACLILYNGMIPLHEDKNHNFNNL